MTSDEFSLAEGGPIYAFQRRIPIAAPDRAGVAQQSLFFISLTWVPLLLLSLAQGVALGTRVEIPFLRDFVVNIRFLITLPMLLAAGMVIDPSVRHAVKQFVSSGLIPSEEMSRFEDAIMKTMKLRDSALAATLIVATAFAPTLWPERVELIAPTMSTWHTTPESADTLSLAGWWFSLISMPIYRVLILRWSWLMIVWASLLWRISRIKLRCIPSHPDRAGGLDFLAHTQLRFAIIGMVASAIFAAALANSIVYEGHTLWDHKYLIPATCAFVVLAIAAPVFAFSGQLRRVKRKGLSEYGVLGSAYAESFQHKWVSGPPPENESLLGNADIQSLADLAGSYEVVRGMRVMLIDKDAFLRIALLVLSPMALLLVVTASGGEILRVLLKVLA